MHAAAAIYEEDDRRLETMLTAHAAERMRTRGLSSSAVMAAILYGRVVHVRGADVHAIGRREVEWYSREGVDLSRFEGIQVVCSLEGAVLTVYRNRDFRGLRPRSSRRCSRRRSW